MAAVQSTSMGHRPNYLTSLFNGFLFFLFFACCLICLPEAHAQSLEFEKSFGSFGTELGQFNSPQGITVDTQDRIIVADGSNARVQLCNDDGQCTSFGEDAPNEGSDQLNFVQDVALDQQRQFIVANPGFSRIHVCNEQGSCSVFGGPGSNPGQFDEPFGVAVDSQNRIIVADTLNHRIQVCDHQGNCSAFGSFGTAPGQFDTPWGVAVDSKDRIIVTDWFNDRIQICDDQGSCTTFGSRGAAPGQFDSPTGVAVDNQDRIVVAEFMNHRFQVCSDQGVCTAYGSQGNGPGQFERPTGVTVDSQGRVIVADWDNHRIQIWRETSAPVFAINPGLNDAWFEPATAGQGFFINVFEDLGQMFVAWFTYDTERPDESISAQLGEPGHRWLTAQGPYAGNQAVLDINFSSGGIFDTPADIENVQDGTLLVEFSDCNTGTISYDIPSIDAQGVVPIQRIVLDNVPGCEAQNTPDQSIEIKQFTSSLSSVEVGGSTTISWQVAGATSCTPLGGAGGWKDEYIALPAESTTLSFNETGRYLLELQCSNGAEAVTRKQLVNVIDAQSQAALFQVNPGLNDAWFEPATAGQGFFINVFEDLGQMFVAWFTYDTERPDESITAKLGEPSHRWLTAQGPYADNQAVLDITISSGGIFDTPTGIENAQDGTLLVEFTGCNSGTISYDIPSIDKQGVVPIQRIALDNVPGCEEQDGMDGFTLSVNKLGTGSGTVISNPDGIDCGSDCSENYTAGTVVTLTAVSEANSTFAGFSGGGCGGTGPCVITVSADTVVSAAFSDSASGIQITALSTTSADPAQVLTVSGSGFDIAAELFVKFFDDTGFSIEAPVLESTDATVRAVVPPYINMASGEFDSGTVNVQVVQVVDNAISTSNSIPGLKIAPLPELTLPPGAVMANMAGFLELTLADVQERLLELETESQGTLDTLDLRNELENMRVEFGLLKAQTRAAMTNPEMAASVGEIGGAPLTLDPTNLALADRWLIAMINAIQLEFDETKLLLEKAHSIQQSDSCPVETAEYCYLNFLLSDDRNEQLANENYDPKLVLFRTREKIKRYSIYFGAAVATITVVAIVAGYTVPIAFVVGTTVVTVVALSAIIGMDASQFSIDPNNPDFQKNVIDDFNSVIENLVNSVISPIITAIDKPSGLLYTLYTGWKPILKDHLPAFNETLKSYTPPPSPALTVSSSSIGFGSVEVGGSISASFTVSNIGEGTLKGSASTAAPFGVTSGTPFSLGPSENQIVTVRFNPTSSGDFTGSVSVSSNGGTAAVGLSGTGLPAPQEDAFLAVGVEPSEGGSVTGPGISCPGDCSETYPINGTPVNVTLVASPNTAEGFAFTGWSGDCSSTGSCELTMDADKGVIANFGNTLNWTLNADWSAPGVGAGGSCNPTFLLSRNGGSAPFSCGDATATFTTTTTTITISGLGSATGPGFSCTGDGGGSSAITETETQFSGGGAISGDVTCNFDDGSSEMSTVTGSFSASAPKESP